jgi:hypothetical protein
MKPIAPAASASYPSAEHVSTGLPINKVIRVKTFSPEEWESFTGECISSLKDLYVSVEPSGGAGDMGIDVAGYTTKDLKGEWDNYQCKHYDHALAPSDIWIEFGKVIYYSYKKKYSVPRKYYFVAPHGVGTKLTRLLRNPVELKQEIKLNWEKHCKNKITESESIPLEDGLLDWFESFDFSIFSSKTVVEMIEQHSKTPFHSVRFGGGLPPRPAVPHPPEDHDVTESRYIKHLFNAYTEHLGTPISKLEDLSTASKPALKKDFLRQRERFYHAEYLRNYARDTVPNGTFERLQNEIYHGVVDIHGDDHADGLARMRATVSQAAQIPITSNPLASVVQTQDRQGICHQLANEDKLIWVSTDEEL